MNHLLSPQIGLETNVDDISNYLKFQDLSDVILVSASYAGMVTTTVADRIPERIGALIYQNAFIARDGVSQHDILPPRRREMIDRELAETGDGWLMPPPDPAFIGVTDANDIAWIAARMTAQSARTFRDRPRITGACERVAHNTYIRATGYPNPTFDGYVTMAETTPGWHTETLDTSHDAMITAPDDIVRILLGVADAIG